MSRFLFCTWPAPGHIYPSVPIALALRDSGHSVAYVTTPGFAPLLGAHGIDIFPLQQPIQPQRAEPRRAHDGARDPRDLFRALFIAPAHGVARAVERAAGAYAPDVIVHDQRSFGPLLVAERDNIPLATLALTCCPLPGADLAPFGLGLPPARDEVTRARYAVLRRRAELSYTEVAAEWNAVRRTWGLPPHSGPLGGAVISRDLLVLLSVAELDYERTDLPPQAHYVGPCTWDPPASLDEDTAAWLAALPAGMPLALVTASTAAAGSTPDRRSAALVEAALAGLEGYGVAVLATVPFDHAVQYRDNGPFARVVRFAPHSALLPRASIVITHGGFGIVTKALRAGVPLVAVPFAGDQPEVAQRVAWARAGRRLDPSQLSAASLAEAVESVLSDGMYRSGARRVQEAMARRDGPFEAASRLAGLATRSQIGQTSRFVEALQ